MGYAKTLMLEQQEQGWEFSDYRICSRCLCDEHLRTRIQEDAIDDQCSFCLSSDRGSAPLDELMRLVASTAHEYFDRAVETLAWDGEEKAYIGETFDTSEMIYDRLDPFTERDDIMDTVVGLFEDDLWCRPDVYHLDGAELYAVSWKQFCETVKHELRFFFGKKGSSDGISETIPVHQMMDTVGHIVLETEGLVSVLPAGTQIVRIRRHRATVAPTTWRDLGPPPEDVAPSNRMSPAGVSMFYAALDSDTARAEMEAGNPSIRDRLTRAVWKNTRDIGILDLTAVPESVPSMFSMPRSEREVLIFLQRFLEDVRMPVEHDGREHIDYVPTQIVTEFFRHGATDDDLQGLEGVVYPSAQHPGGRSIVIFVSKDDLDPGRGNGKEDPLLVLDPHSIVRLPARRFRMIWRACKRIWTDSPWAKNRLWEETLCGGPPPRPGTRRPTRRRH